MIISVKPCVNCGASDVSDFREYDGCLGYEAIICKRCGYIYDHTGVYSPEEDSVEDYQDYLRKSKAKPNSDRKTNF